MIIFYPENIDGLISSVTHRIETVLVSRGHPNKILTKIALLQNSSLFIVFPMTSSVVTLPEGQLRSPKETLMSVEFFCKLLLGNKELRDSCSEQFSHHFSPVLWAVLYEMQLIGSSIL